MKELFKVQCFHIKSFISSSEVSAFDCVVQSELLAAFWLMMFWEHFVFQSRSLSWFGNGPFLKSKNRLFLFFVFLLMRSERALMLLRKKWSFIAKRGSNCSDLRICCGTNWSLMDDFGTIVPKNVFPSITFKRVFIRRWNRMVLHC